MSLKKTMDTHVRASNSGRHGHKNTRTSDPDNDVELISAMKAQCREHTCMRLLINAEVESRHASHVNAFGLV